jgi:hypothetical protein
MCIYHDLNMVRRRKKETFSGEPQAATHTAIPPFRNERRGSVGRRLISATEARDKRARRVFFPRGQGA